MAFYFQKIITAYKCLAIILYFSSIANAFASKAKPNGSRKNGIKIIGVLLAVISILPAVYRAENISLVWEIRQRSEMN